MTASPPGLSPALETTIERYRATVLDIGARHGLSGDDLDEVLQAVRIRLWRGLKESGRISEVTPFYIRQAARYAALDLLRERRSTVADREALLSPESPLAETDSPARRLERQEIAAGVATAIERLAPSRQPVVRMYLSGYNSEEIANVFGWTEAKARNLLYRGLADLRRLLAGMGLSPESAS